MNAQTDILQTSLLVLRVIGGRQSGAEYRLSTGIRVRIGHDFQNDIVLRNTANKDTALTIDVTDGVAILSVVSGEISVLGRAVIAGENLPLPVFMPVKIGEVVFAIGNPESERWDEAAQISAVASIPNTADVSSDASMPSGAVAVPENVSLNQRVDGIVRHFSTSLRPVNDAIAIERRWPVYAALVASLLLAAVLFVPISGWVNNQSSGPEATQKMLVRVGFPELTVRETAGGGLMVSGVLRDDAQLQRLRTILDEKRPGTVIDVNTMDAVAAGVTDMLVAQSLDADAKPGSGRNIIITSEYLPTDRQTELAAQIRKDIPAITKIVFKIDTNRGEPELQYFFASEKFGLASFVDGDPSYIATADGTKWFKGATVPTGHVITDIGNGAVRFEREGQIEELRVAPPEETAPVNGEASTNSATSNIAGIPSNKNSEKVTLERNKI
jgi:type III secretion protein D